MIKYRYNTSLYLTPCSQSPMDDADYINILDLKVTGPGSIPQKPLALVAKLSDSERSALESGRTQRTLTGQSKRLRVDIDAAPMEIQYCMSIQHSPTFIFVTTVGESVLSTLQKRS